MKKISFLIAFLVCIFSILFYIEAEGPSPTIIYIDPGHGGMDGGAVVDGVKES
ncbi:MAG TPA: N-acetylmuramoyl-L-alanine amidase, partial [Candidatus Pelethenecus faecipullorum]|nr:N-acetylmuramoyl-L-alanine amidase [Candidatus Pelethenecus faecipullorum]